MHVCIYMYMHNPTISIIKGTTFKEVFWQNQAPEYYLRFRQDFVGGTGTTFKESFFEPILVVDRRITIAIAFTITIPAFENL